jgi:hypothetical protein
MSEEEILKEGNIPSYLGQKTLDYIRVKTLLHERLFFKKGLPYDTQASDFYIILFEMVQLTKHFIDNGFNEKISSWYGSEVPENDKLRRQFFKKGLKLTEEFDKELEKLGVTSLNTFGGYIPL